jgi:hypothetical protein
VHKSVKERRLTVKERVQRMLDKKVSSVSKIITRSSASTMAQTEKHIKPVVNYEEMKPVKLDFDNEVIQIESGEGKVSQVYLETSETESSPMVYTTARHRRSLTDIPSSSKDKDFINSVPIEVGLPSILSTPVPLKEPLADSPPPLHTILPPTQSSQDIPTTSPELEAAQEAPKEEIDWSRGIENITYMGEDDVRPGFPIMV